MENQKYVKRILLIEKDSSLFQAIKQLDDPEYLAFNYEMPYPEDFSFVQNCSPDIIVLDLDEPTEKNLRFCSHIRSFLNVPILILSPLDSPKIVAKVLNSGADDYLIKPFRILELKAHMDSLIKRSQVNIPTARAEA